MSSIKIRNRPGERPRPLYVVTETGFSIIEPGCSAVIELTDDVILSHENPAQMLSEVQSGLAAEGLGT